jgi:hypothetical protein
MLVQIEDPHLDLSGDIGAIGRLSELPGGAGDGFVLDLKGHQYGGTIVPSSTFLVVGFGNKEAKIESVVSDFVQCEHLANLVEGLSGRLSGAGAGAFEDVDTPEGLRLAHLLGHRKGGRSDDDGDGSGSEMPASEDGADASSGQGRAPVRKPKGGKMHGRKVQVRKKRKASKK